MDSSLPGSSVHGILQARILEWVAVASSRGSSPPRKGACTCFLLCRQILYPVPPRKPSEVTEGPLLLRKGYLEKELRHQRASELFLFVSAANGSVTASTTPATPNLCTQAYVCDTATDHLAS